MATLVHTQLRFLTLSYLFPANSFLPISRWISHPFLFAKVSQKRLLDCFWVLSLTLMTLLACDCCWWVCPRICCITLLIVLSIRLCLHLFLWRFIKRKREASDNSKNLQIHHGILVSVNVPPFPHNIKLYFSVVTTKYIANCNIHKKENLKCRISKQSLHCDPVPVKSTYTWVYTCRH